jgi:hypothetical protein
MSHNSGNILTKLEFSRQIFEKSPNIKDLPCECSDMQKLLVAFDTVVNTPTKQRSFPQDPVFTLKFTVDCKERCSPDEPLRIHHQLYL